MNFPTLQSFYQRLFVFLPIALDLASVEFNYDDPHKWPNEFPTCRGFRQSPISIYTAKTIPISLPPLLFQLYDEPFNELLTLKNNGLTVEFEIPETVYRQKPFITGGFLTDIFTAEAVHFHWGSPENKGSEHELNGRRYDLEMHIVHKNSKYSAIKEAREFEDGLSVVAVLFKAVKLENFYYNGLNVLYEILDELIKFNTTAETTSPISLGSLLGDINRRDFITYRGSLTTPPCSESVTWHIFPEVLPISYFELSKFWNLLEKRELPLQNNFRPIQALEYRKVYRQTTLIWTENIINIPTENLIDYTEEW